MGYSDFVIATPEPMFTIFLNIMPFTAGVGTMFTAYWKQGGFCVKTFILGWVQNWLVLVGYGLLYSFWLSLLGLIFLLGGYIWTLWHTFQVYKVSRATYHL